MPAKRLVRFKVVATSGMAGYWLRVDEVDLKLVNGVGQIELAVGAEHVLLWWMVGNPGSSLQITGTVGKRVVVEVKATKIPASSHKGAGYRRFKV